ncbi:MAG TPA: tRNA (adenosine(37)-N6)-threonylcarbamoyltransferase complex dimerization subunit type 1 TsaB [Caulobacteraceae bacterium]|nr:tRNA (adenosine(37)-N6)-threonylcarbamoyltransferase complex dimerization subunit type 1 TsaB [Caulobacteraceae bacterium]
MVLALDTCLDACSAAVWADGRVLAQMSEPMRRGHQERLAVMGQAVMAAAATDFSRLDRIGATVGPGSFTGLRVGLAFAKGLGLALDRPVVGVGVLEALVQDAGDGFVASVVDARRDQVYLQAFDAGRALMAPDVLPVETAAARLAELWTGGPAALTGPGAALLAGVLPGAGLIERAAPDPVAIARLAAQARAPFPPPRPLYLRAPDARLAGS